ncbi:hypothetical protein JYU23_00490 [bacterium AH-315-C07]|nr:hypothetical protein [bacterium AH-315-C07]
MTNKTDLLNPKLLTEAPKPVIASQVNLLSDRTFLRSNPIAVRQGVQVSSECLPNFMGVFRYLLEIASQVTLILHPGFVWLAMTQMEFCKTSQYVKFSNNETMSF